MKLAIACAAAVLFGMLILQAPEWEGHPVTAQQSKEQTRLATESREQYQKRIEAKLGELGRQISALEAKAQAQGDQTRQELRKQLKDLTQQHQSTARQYEELKLQARETWKKMKPQMDAAVDELEKEYERLASRVHEPQK